MRIVELEGGPLDGTLHEMGTDSSAVSFLTTPDGGQPELDDLKPLLPQLAGMDLRSTSYEDTGRTSQRGLPLYTFRDYGVARIGRELE